MSRSFESILPNTIDVLHSPDTKPAAMIVPSPLHASDLIGSSKVAVETQVLVSMSHTRIIPSSPPAVIIFSKKTQIQFCCMRRWGSESGKFMGVGGG